MSNDIELKRPECGSCEYWETVTGVFLDYENPTCTCEEKVNSETGIVEKVMTLPDIEIKTYDRDPETRAFCSFPLELCKIDAQGVEYVICDGCPMFREFNRCPLSCEDADCYKGKYVVLNCELREVRTKQGVFAKQTATFNEVTDV